jgi:hypothetical protein
MIRIGMRLMTNFICGAAVLSACDAVCHAQEVRKDQRILARYGIEANVEFYPQGTPQETLASAAKALQNKRYEYIVAHILDAEFVDNHIAEAAARMRPGIEQEFETLRAAQKANPSSITPETYVPVEPQLFAERIETEATRRAFQKVASYVAETLNEAPENTLLLAKFAKAGTVTTTGDTATATLKGELRKVYLKQSDMTIVTEGRNNEGQAIMVKQTVKRWAMEDRQFPLAPPETGK